MEHYVTLFDSMFLPQGLALHRSLQRHAREFTLWMLCMDDAAHRILSVLNLPHVRLIRLGDVETPALQSVRRVRTRAEYCWTLTPHTPAIVFAADPAAQRVTYVDADVWFLSDPQTALRGFSVSGKFVQITEHAFGVEHRALHAAGRFCVQFMTFVRGRSDRVRAWWEERCLEWCYARWEDGRFGDQMYLEDWPERFADDVHVLDAPAMCQGPWNISRFDANDAVMYHFHGLRLARGARVWLTTAYGLSEQSLERFYRPYATDLSAAIADLRVVGHQAQPQIGTSLLRLRLTEAARRLKKLRLSAWQPMSLQV
jgi:hypothetical protein